MYKGPIPNATAILPQCNEEGEILSVPLEVLDRRLGKVGNSAQVYVLIRWSNGTKDDATWELHSDIVNMFLDQCNLLVYHRFTNSVYKFASSGILADVIQGSSSKGLSKIDVKRCARSILKGLSHVHKRGISEKIKAG
ncbi:reverse transcriptase [Tanacetum coccineum]